MQALWTFRIAASFEQSLPVFIRSGSSLAAQSELLHRCDIDQPQDNRSLNNGFRFSHGARVINQQVLTATERLSLRRDHFRSAGDQQRADDAQRQILQMLEFVTYLDALKPNS
jgi:hypothetical protein